MNKNKVYTHVSLFSGSGGLDIGLEQAGFHTVWANDFNHDACETHRLWSNATVVEGDIGKVDYDTIPDCDIASFGFPCQGFSLSGPRKIDDRENDNYDIISKAGMYIFWCFLDVKCILDVLQYILKALTYDIVTMPFWIGTPVALITGCIIIVTCFGGSRIKIDEMHEKILKNIGSKKNDT